MNSFSISQCAALFKVDETFVRFVMNKLDINTIDIPFESLGVFFEEVLFYKEQFDFLGVLDKPTTNDKCLVFYLSYDDESKRGNAWCVTDFAIKTIRIPFDETKIHIEEDKKWFTKKKKWLDDLAYKDYVYVDYGHEEWEGDKNYCIVVPISSLLRNPPVFHPVIRKNDLFYVDYGQLTEKEILESHEYYDLVKDSRRGYCILDKQGNRITRFYRWIRCNKDGSIWATQKDKGWAGKSAYYNERGSIRSSVKYESDNGFSEGLCCVSVNNSWGAIDREGKVVIDYKYQSMKPFSSGISEVTILDRPGYINKEGKAVTKNGKLLISKSGETYSFAWVNKGKYRTDTLHMFTIEGEDLCYRLNGPAYDDDAFYFGVSDDGHIGYLNFNNDIIIPLIYKEASRFYNGIARVVTDNGRVLFLNGLNRILDVTQEEFERKKEEQEEIENRRVEALRPKPSPYRYYTVHYTAWNGMKMVYRTKAKTKEEAIDDFWDSGVQFGANIDFVD